MGLSEGEEVRRFRGLGAGTAGMCCAQVMDEASNGHNTAAHVYESSHGEGLFGIIGGARLLLCISGECVLWTMSFLF